MKKFMILSLALVMVLLSTVSVFAGSVPEDLLYEDTAQVFLGTVVNHTTKERPSAPYFEIDSLECIPTEKIKGDIKIGVKQSYQKCYYSSADFKPDVEYLFGYFDNNNVYIYEIESREDGKFKLVDSNINDMTKRLEDALNEGLFEQAEQRRIDKENTSQSGVETSTETQTSDTDIAPQIDMEEDHQDFISQSLIKYIVAGAVVLVVLILGAILIIKRKSK